MLRYCRYLDITKAIMEQIYLREKSHCELVKTRANRVKFLLDYSKSLSIIEHSGITYESNMN